MRPEVLLHGTKPVPATQLNFAPAPRFTMQGRRRLAEAQLARGLLDRVRIYGLAALRRELGDPLDSIALIQKAAPQSDREWMQLSSACMDVGDAERNGLAANAFRRVLAMETEDDIRVAALIGLARVLLRMGEAAEAKQLLAAAVALDPAHPEAIARYGRALVATAPDAAVRWLEQRIAVGNVRAGVLGSWAGALAAAGRPQDARAAIGLDRFLRISSAGPPPGWASLEAFHAAIGREFADHPARRPERPGSASVDSVRIDEPHLGGSRHMRALEDHLAALIGAHLEELAGDHPFVRARPAAARVRYWALLSDGEGHQIPHMHPGGWLSGVYYAAVPDIVAGGRDTAGCLQFELPEKVSAPGCTIEGPVVRPQPGLFATFPSHAHHRTFAYPPAGGAQQRIVVAFDLEPCADG